MSLLLLLRPLAPDASTSSTTAGATSLTWSHTVGSSGANRLLTVGVSLLNALSQTVTGVTYNGVALTSKGSVANGIAGRVELWYLVAPTTGANNVVVSFSASVAAIGGAQSWVGVDASNPLGTLVAASGTTTDATVTVAAVIGQFVQDVVADAAVAVTVGAGQTEEWNTGVTGLRGAGSRESGATSVVMDWTSGLSAVWAIAGVPVQPVGTASGNTTVNGAQAAETDTANTGTPVVVVAGTRADQSSTANAGTPAATSAGVSATEADTTATGTIAAVVAGSRGTESETGTVGATLATFTGTQATEADLANTGTVIVVVAGSLAQTTDTGAAGAATVVVDGLQGLESTTGANGTSNTSIVGQRATDVATANSGSCSVAVNGSSATSTSVGSGGVVLVVLPGGQVTTVTTASSGQFAFHTLGVFATEADSGFTGIAIGGAAPVRVTMTIAIAERRMTIAVHERSMTIATRERTEVISSAEAAFVS